MASTGSNDEAGWGKDHPALLTVTETDRQTDCPFLATSLI